MSEIEANKHTESASHRVADFTITWRKLLTLIAALFSLLLATGIPRTSFDTSLAALLTQSDPYLDELELMQEAFPSSLEVRFAFVANENQTVFNRKLLTAIEELKDNYLAIPFTKRLTSILDYESAETGQRLFIGTLNSYSDAELNKLVNIALNDRLLTANLLSDSATLTFAIITLDDENISADERLDIANAVILLRDELRQRHPEVIIHANSEVMLEQSSKQAMVDDLSSLMPFVILACILAICYCFKSITLGICILAHTLFTLLCTIGALGYFGFAFNNISIIAPLVLVIISVANSVHIISIYKQSLYRGTDKTTAMHKSISHNFQPITLAALTTAIGFSSLNMCSSPAIQEFGQIVALGIIFAYMLTLSLLPAVLIWITSTKEVANSAGVPFMERTLQKIGDITRRRDTPIFWTCTLLAITTFLFLPLNETNFNRLDFIANDIDIKQYYDEVSTHYERGPTLNYGVSSRTEWSVIEPDFLHRVDKFVAWVNTQAEVESTVSIANVVKRINQLRYDDKESFYQIPEDFNTIANYLLAYAMGQSDNFPLFSFVNTDFSMTNLFINAVPMSNQELIDFDKRLTEKFQQDFPDADLLHGSSVLLFSRMDKLVTIELLQGYSISLVLITISLIIGMRSLYFGILSIIPNLLPATIVFGFWGLFIGQLDPFVMMLFSISIGLVVDDTVHLLSHYLGKRREGKEKTDAINYAIKTAGPALSITTIVLALGTTILIGANTLYFQQAAKLLVPIVVLALLLDLLYLPTILRRFDKQFKHGGSTAS
jgi:predicted RND superfamily exporter protein